MDRNTCSSHTDKNNNRLPSQQPRSSGTKQREFNPPISSLLPSNRLPGRPGGQVAWPPRESLPINAESLCHSEIKQTQLPALNARCLWVTKASSKTYLRTNGGQRSPNTKRCSRCFPRLTSVYPSRVLQHMHYKLHLTEDFKGAGLGRGSGPLKSHS